MKETCLKRNILRQMAQVNLLGDDKARGLAKKDVVKLHRGSVAFGPWRPWPSGLVIIHFINGYPVIKTIQRSWGSSIYDYNS